MACSATFGLTVIQSMPGGSSTLPLVSMASRRPAPCRASISSRSTCSAGSPPGSPRPPGHTQPAAGGGELARLDDDLGRGEPAAGLELRVAIEAVRLDPALLIAARQAEKKVRGAGPHPLALQAEEDLVDQVSRRHAARIPEDARRGRRRAPCPPRGAKEGGNCR